MKFTIVCFYVSFYVHTLTTASLVVWRGVHTPEARQAQTLADPVGATPATHATPSDRLTLSAASLVGSLRSLSQQRFVVK